MKISEIIGESKSVDLPESGDHLDFEFDDVLVEGVIVRVDDDIIVEVGDTGFQAIVEAMENATVITEAEYQGRKVQLNKPMAGDSKKFKVYVKNAKGNVVKVNFGQKGVKIKKNNPARRKSFRARHNCDTAKDKTTARYWSCRKW